jgi:hypothetical protein
MKTRIFQLEQEEGIIEGDDKLKSYITNYYKKQDLHYAPQKNNFSMMAFGILFLRRNACQTKRNPKSKNNCNSHFWSGHMKVKYQFLVRGSSFHVHDGNQSSFWNDKWIGDKPLKAAHPTLFNIVMNKNAPVASVLSTIPVYVCFRCTLADENFEKWYDLVFKN